MTQIAEHALCADFANAAKEFTVMSLKNVGSADRIARIVIGLVLIALVFVGPKTPWGWIGIVPLLTAIVSFCPLYRLLGIRTDKS
ncbi:MAG: DUF2892 domain-containing protein [Rhodanobacter sp.]|jgi:hypothetical protein|nr:DUF2892 domain-containing protein [Rhodanobacter sp.]